MRFLPEGPSFCAGRQAVKEAATSRQAAGKEAGREADMQAGSRQGGRQICMHAGRLSSLRTQQTAAPYSM